MYVLFSSMLTDFDQDLDNYRLGDIDLIGIIESNIKLMHQWLVFSKEE